MAFPNLKWADWNRETETGQPNPLRPIVLTHAGDGSNRVFVATTDLLVVRWMKNRMLRYEVAENLGGELIQE